MLLELEDVDLFFRLQADLMHFVNRERRVLENVHPVSPAAYSTLPNESRHAVHQAFLDTPSELIDAFVLENPEDLDEDELEIIRSWKHPVAGRFFIFRQLKRHTIFLSEKDPPLAYGVVALTQPFAEVTGQTLPVLAETILLPFRGRIVYDGMLISHRIRFGGGIKEMLNNSYRAAKEQSGVITSLVAEPATPSPPKRRRGSASSRPPSSKRKSPKKKAPKPASGKAGKRQRRIENLAAGIRRTLGEIHQFETAISQFEERDQPAFQKWLDRHLGKERDRNEELQGKVEDLEDLLDEIDFRWAGREYRTKRETCEAVLAESGGQDQDPRPDPEDAPPFGDPDGGDPGAPPDFMVDFLFAEFMESARGIDIGTMTPKAHDKARAEFEATFQHAAEGNHLAFEKALLKTGADDSDENKRAVKTVFRRLAKRLHPDHNPDLGDDAKAIWEEALAASRALDSRALERLEIRWMIERGDPLTPDLGPRLRDLRESLDDQFRHLRLAWEECQDHPMWGRDGKLPPKSFAIQLSREIETENFILSARLEQLQKELDRLRRKPASPRKRPNAAKKRKQAGKKRAAKKKSAAGSGRKPSSKKKSTQPHRTKPGDFTQDEFDF